MFSKACEYAIRAMMFLAHTSDREKPVSMKRISDSTGAPPAYIAKIMQDLSRKKLVSSIKGPGGGFYLSNREMGFTIAAIVKAVDGRAIYDQCVLGLRKCSVKKPCPVHDEYKVIRRKMIQMIESHTVRDFTAKLNDGKQFLK